MLAMLALLSTQALADDIPPCAPPAGVRAFYNLKDIPKSLAEALDKEFGYIAAPSEDFDSTDVISTGHFIRLIFVWRKGNVWLVAVERGGLAYNDRIRKYASIRDEMKFISEEIAFPPSVCSASKVLIQK